MSIKYALLASTAALALTSPAFGAAGDAYVSLFGGWSSAAEEDIYHHRMETAGYTRPAGPQYLGLVGQNTVANFSLDGVRSTVVFSKTTVVPTKVGSTTKTIYRGAFYGRNAVFSYSRFQDYKYTRNFSGDVSEDGWVVGAALGIELMVGLRAEVEAAFRRYDLEQAGTLNTVNINRTYLRRDAIYNYRYHANTPTGYNLPSTSPFVNLPTDLSGPPYSTATTGTKSNPGELAYSVVTKVLGTVTRSELKSPITQFNRFNYNTQMDATNVPVSVDGELSAFSFMVNLWYDLPLGNTGLVPFIGGGVGVANLTLNYRMRGAELVFGTGSSVLPGGKYNEFLFHKTDSTVVTSKTYNQPGPTPTYTKQILQDLGYIAPGTTNVTRAFSTDIKEDEAVLAYQFGAGLGYEFRNGLRLTAEYRYFATGNASFGFGADASIESNDVLIGVSFPLGRQRVRD